MTGLYSFWALYGHTPEAFILNIYNSPAISNCIKPKSDEDNGLFSVTCEQFLSICNKRHCQHSCFIYFAWIYQTSGGTKVPDQWRCCILPFGTKWKLKESKLRPMCLSSFVDVRKLVSTCLTLNLCQLNPAELLKRQRLVCSVLDIKPFIRNYNDFKMNS